MKEKILTKLMELRSDDLAAMEFAAGRSVEMIEAYCNIAEVPEELSRNHPSSSSENRA